MKTMNLPASCSGYRRTALPRAPMPPVSVLSAPSGRFRVSATPDQRRDVPPGAGGQCRCSLRQEVTLIVDGANEVVAKKALLAEWSSKLGDMLESDITQQSFEVGGSERAWQFVADFPKMSTKARSTAFQANDPEAARLVGQLLPVVTKYDIPQLREECESFLSSWTTFSADAAKEEQVENPSNPVWWINLAAQLDRPTLAGPAIRAMVKDTSYFSPEMIYNLSHYSSYGSSSYYQESKDCAWLAARKQVLKYGKGQQGPLWELVCSFLEGCDSG